MSEIALGVRRICDTCNKSCDFPTVNLRPQDAQELQNWVGTVGFVMVGEDQLQPYIRHFCSKECAIIDLNKGPNA